MDANIFVAALLKDSVMRELIVYSPYNLLFPEIIFDEIEEHKEELIEKSGLSEQEFNQLSLRLLNHVKIISNNLTVPHKQEAKRIINHIDSDDVPFIATRLAFNYCPIWSDDAHFQQQNEIEILTTEQLVSMFNGGNK